MADEDVEGLDQLAEPDDPDIVDLETLDDEELGDDVLPDDELADDELADDADVVVDEEDPVAPVVTAPSEEDDDDDEEDDDLDPDDVEAGLDVILKDRLVVLDEEDEEEEDETPDPEERAEGSTKVLPKRPGEFVCQSCFLVKHPSQLADARRQLCRDCV